MNARLREQPFRLAHSDRCENHWLSVLLEHTERETLLASGRPRGPLESGLLWLSHRRNIGRKKSSTPNPSQRQRLLQSAVEAVPLSTRPLFPAPPRLLAHACQSKESGVGSYQKLICNLRHTFGCRGYVGANTHQQELAARVAALTLRARVPMPKSNGIGSQRAPPYRSASQVRGGRL